MKVLLVGKWGKSHAFAKALKKNDDVELHAYMDRENAGIKPIVNGFRLGDLEKPEEIVDHAVKNKMDYVVVNPEMTLSAGIRPLLEERGIPSFGPPTKCAELEGDKEFTRNLLRDHIGNNLDFKVFRNPEKAKEYIDEADHEVAVKPAGVTEGDGVKVMGVQLEGKEDAKEYVDEIFLHNLGRKAKVLIEERLRGEEYTIQAFMDGKSMKCMPVVRDYKLLLEGERGPNTPGMGSYTSPDHLLPTLSREDHRTSVDIMKRTMEVMKEEYGENYKGILSGQFILTDEGPKVIEFNVRAGDSEILNIEPLLETDLMEIFWAIDEQRLSDIDINFGNQATVCKYVVPPGFPRPKGPIKAEIDEESIEREGGRIYYSCFENGKEDSYYPSPRAFGITGVADTISEANEICERSISHIHGDGLYHRKDIGTPELIKWYA